MTRLPLGLVLFHALLAAVLLKGRKGIHIFRRDFFALRLLAINEVEYFVLIKCHLRFLI